MSRQLRPRSDILSAFRPAAEVAPLIMIGLVLVADGFGQHIPKGYIYAAMAFSVFVEMINLWVRRRAERKTAPVKLHETYAGDGEAAG